MRRISLAFGCASLATMVLAMAACADDDSSRASAGDDSSTTGEAGTEGTTSDGEESGESGENGESGDSDSGTDSGETGTETGTDSGESTDSGDTTDTGTTGTDDEGEGPCVSDDDCLGNSGGPVCSDDGECVPCTPENDVCDAGQFCSDDNMCTIGCNDQEDCEGDLVCDTGSNLCTGCVEDFDCGLGSICDAGECVAGCTDEQPCQDGFTCCSGSCVNPLDDVLNCGGCGNDCNDDPYFQAESVCDGGSCSMGACLDNYNDCNVSPTDGCETQAACACTPGEQIPCYTGLPANTEGVGECHGGMRTCNDQGTGYGACEGQVTPGTEVCGNSLDDDCDGMTDENTDEDNDGFGVCENDCCDAVGTICTSPELVNPGAFEVPGNNVDDDCDGVIDNSTPICDAGLNSGSSNAMDHAKAIELCQTTTENGDSWGVISAQLAKPNGSGIDSDSRAIRPNWGVIPPWSEQDLPITNNFSVLASGHAAAPGQTNPNYSAFQTGTDVTGDVATSGFVSPLNSWLSSNGGSYPTAPGCPSGNSSTAFDPAMLKLRVRVPTNANSFSTQMFFLSAEYPEWVCDSYNDFFVAVLDSNDSDNPNDGNIAVFNDGNNLWPVGVNIIDGSPALFQECTSYSFSQCSSDGNYTACNPQYLPVLSGTGFDGGSCDAGGGTGWLQMNGNVEPGEVIEIAFAIWDVGDSVYDSVVFLDQWRWSVQASDPGVQPPG